MNVLLGVERALLADVARTSRSLQPIADQTMKGENRTHQLDHSSRGSLGLALFYGYEILLHAIHLLKHPKRLALYHTGGSAPPRRLYQFHAHKNDVSVYTLPTSNFCTCTFYQEHVLQRQVYFACPHNLAIKLHERLYAGSGETEIERFDVPHEYLIDKLSKLFEQSCETSQ